MCISFLLMVTNYKKFNSLKQHHVLVHSSVCQNSHRVTGFSAQGITRPKSMCQSGWVLVYWLWGQKFTSMFILAIDRSQFLMVIELRSLLAASLSAGSHTAPRGHPHPLIHSSLHFEANSSVSQNFRLLLWPAGEKKQQRNKIPTLSFLKDYIIASSSSW